MPRIARIVLPGVPHHLTQRGNQRQPVFFTDEDRVCYLRLLKEEAEAHGLTFIAYCLMTNHIHHVSTPVLVTSLARACGRTHARYTSMINARRGLCGHLWQNRFFSCALDEEHLWRAVRYVERNPRRAGLVTRPEDYPWSSAAAHLGGPDPSGLLDLDAWSTLWTPDTWREYLMAPDDLQDTQQLRLNTQTGRPLGSDAFLDDWETRLGCRLRTLAIGRPRNAREEKVREGENEG